MINFGSNLSIPLGIGGILLIMFIGIFLGFIVIFRVDSVKILSVDNTSYVIGFDLGYFGGFLDGIIRFSIGFRV